MIARGLKIHICRTALRMEGVVFFKELRTEGGRGSGGPASHTGTFPDLLPPLGLLLTRSDFFWPECMSEKSMLVFGNGTIPGSEMTARVWEINMRNTIVLKSTTFRAPHSLKHNCNWYEWMKWWLCVFEIWIPVVWTLPGWTLTSPGSVRWTCYRCSIYFIKKIIGSPTISLKIGENSGL